MSPEYAHGRLPAVFRSEILGELNRLTVEASRGNSVTEDDFSPLGIEELKVVVTDMTQSRNAQGAYDVLSRTSESGQPYYDLIFGPLDRRARTVMGRALDLLEDGGLVGVDLGAGTGAFTSILSLCCCRVVAVEINPDLLGWAEKKLAAIKQAVPDFKYSTVAGDILKADLPSNVFDVAISHGLSTSFLPRQLPKLYATIFRILKPGGRYYRYNTDDSGGVEVYSGTPRAEMAGLAAKIIHKLSYTRLYRQNPYIFISGPKSQGFSLSIHYTEDGEEDESIFRWTKPI